MEYFKDTRQCADVLKAQHVRMIQVVQFTLDRAAVEEEQKEETGKALSEVWALIRPGLSEEEIREIVGVPQQVIPVDPEVWVYQVGDLKGCILFRDGFVVGYKTPE